MASSIAITASLQRAYCSSSLHVTKKLQQPRAGPARSVGTKQLETDDDHVVALEGLNIPADRPQESKLGLSAERRSSGGAISREIDHSAGGTSDGTTAASTPPKFNDERWKNGTWDLNMFVRDGKMDWDGVIVAEARRRKFLEMCPESTTNQEPVLFRTSIIPWWAWMMRSHLPEAELINGRAAMVGFFMAYLVDGLTGLDMVGQTGNFICKAGLLLTVMGVIFLRRARDFDGLRRVAEEATLYDQQWRSSWQRQDAGDGDLPRDSNNDI